MSKPSKIKKFIVKKMFELSQDSITEVDDGLTSEDSTVAFCRRLAAEGCVLVRNNDKVLPLLKEDRVALFGRCQKDYFYVGYGSGGDVRAPYKISPIEAFDEAGVNYDKELAEIYSKWSALNPPDDGVWGLWPTNYDEMPLDESVVANAAMKNDKAIVFIGRSSGEDRETLKEAGSWYLTKEEENMLSLVTESFDKVCVVLNVGNIIDMSWADKYGVSSILFAWQGGQESGHGLCDVLTGVVNPSGKLTDTIADIEAYPSTKGFGNKKEPVYTEDIYVGYRYFETFNLAAVKYPFGFGLSYTDFETKSELVYSEGTKIRVETEVKNIGSVSGREVVQLYMNASDGVLGRPDRELIAFVKTPEIAPGESIKVELEADLKDFASYDDTGVTGHKNAYILEEGLYEFYVGTDVRTAVFAGAIALNDIVVRETLEALPPNREFERMVKKAGKPVYMKVPAGTRNLRERALKSVRLPIKKVVDEKVTLSDVKSGKVSMGYFVSTLSTEALECLTRGALDCMNSAYGPTGNAGCFGGTCLELEAKGVPAISTNDGPSGVRLQAHSTLFPIGAAVSATFDPELVEEVFEAIGRETIERGSRVLLSPGMNIRRNPLCGRNFEYFSEDPYVTAVIATAYVKGVQKSGASATPKHLCCNNQETGRNVYSSLVSQRALREIYLRAFEYCIKNAKPDFIMTSYNKVNGAYSYHQYDLCTVLLRDEFGFEGLTMTDWWTKEGKSKEFPALKNHALRIRSGNNIFMPGAPSMGPNKNKPDPAIFEALRADDGLSLGELQENAKRVLTYCMRYID